MTQSEIVDIVCEWAARWRAPDSPWRRAARSLDEPFPFAMTRISLDALLESLSPDRLWELIDGERIRDAAGVPLIGHVIAGNTPLLSWVSLLRALLMRSASFVKLPSGPAGEWGRLFVHSLAEIAPQPAAIRLAQWPGGTAKLDAALCRSVDLLMAYGSDGTIETLRRYCPSTKFLGCGHHISFGIMLAGCSYEEAAVGFARDILLFDQGGCLSPQTIFAEGDQEEAAAFGSLLAAALERAVCDLPLPAREPSAAARVRDARLLGRMEADTRLLEDADLRWTVVVRSERAFVLSPGCGVVSIQPLADMNALPESVRSIAGHLQGCAVGAPTAQRFEQCAALLQRLGVSRVCRPGALQEPPFSWRQDGRDVLRTLLPGRT